MYACIVCMCKMMRGVCRYLYACVHATLRLHWFQRKILKWVCRGGVLQQGTKLLEHDVRDLHKRRLTWVESNNYQKYVFLEPLWAVDQTKSAQSRTSSGYWPRRSPSNPAIFASKSFVDQGYTRGER